MDEPVEKQYDDEKGNAPFILIDAFIQTL